MRIASPASWESRRRKQKEERPMYPIAIYPPVKQLDDREARLRTGPRPGAGERFALRWRPVRFG
jgi:hypothetical protein